jgi:aminopeptidase N
VSGTAAAYRWLGCLAAIASLGEAAHPVTLGGADADYRSYANVDEFRLTHLELILDVDFTNRELDGIAVLELKRVDPHSTELVLDTRGLRILSVNELTSNFVGATEKTKAFWVERPFHLGKANPELGSPLYIDLAPSKEGTETVKIEYETTDQSTALHWRVPEKTDGAKPSGKLQPYMYSSPGPDQARSWIPLQDTPKVRLTYKAFVKTGQGLLALMGAGNDPKAKHNGSYNFLMPRPVPPDLLNLAIGDFESRETGPRSGVFAESSLSKPAAKEFADTEAMLVAAEGLLGHYPWGRFDELVMPSAFPVAQAAFPAIAYVSPTLIAGDKSLESPLANAVAQSWTGQLITNATWRDRWLNQAFATYLQHRIMSVVVGAPREALEESLAVEAFRAAAAACDSDDQLLATDLTDVESDEDCAGVAAEKGSLLLTWLEAKFGRDKFDPFVRGYVTRFASQSVSTEQFESYLQENLLDRYPGIVSRAAVGAWISNPGVPEDAVLPASSAATESIDAARASFVAGRLAAAKIDVHDWAGPHWIYFLRHMPRDLKAAQLGELDRAFSLTASRNAEVAQAWLQLAIRADYRPAYARLEEYLKSVGRTRLIAPLYAELARTPAGYEFAKRIYTAARSGYDARTARRIDTLVKIESAADE